MQLAAAWRVEDLSVADTLAFVMHGMREGERVVLKLARDGSDEWNSGAVAAAFDGHGMVRVLEHTPGAVLLEALQPGTSLVQLVATGRDQEADRILAHVIESMLHVEPDPAGYATAESWGSSFDRYLAGPDTQLDRMLVRSARAVYREQCASQGTTRLLHGDLHHENILYDDARGWTAIDPKGIVAELEYELGAALRNPPGFPYLYASARAVDRRIDAFAQGLPVDRERVRRWAFAQAVLSLIWMVEDDDVPDAAGPSWSVAHVLQE